MAGWDGNGNFTLTYDWTDDRDAAINITASRMDTQFEDVRGGVEAALAKNGENTATQVNCDNLRLDGNTLSSTNTNGNVSITPNGTGKTIISGLSTNYQNHGNTGTTEDISVDVSAHRIVLDDNVTLTFSAPVASGNYSQFTLIVVQDGTGGRTITWPASVIWANGVEPSIASGVSERTDFQFYTVDGGTEYMGVRVAFDAG